MRFFSAMMLLILLFGSWGCKQSPQYNPNGSTPNASGPQTEASVDAPQTVMVKTRQEMPLRAKPASRAKQLLLVPAGEALEADDVSGGYVRVSYKGAVGWLETATLMFREDGRAFFEHRRQARPDRRRQSGSVGGALQQCAHVDGTGRRCLYQTADDSGKCPEHQ